MLAMERERHRLGVTLRLVVGAPGAHRIDATPVGLGLRAHLRIAVDLRGRCEQEHAAGLPGEVERVERPERAALERLDGMTGEVLGARRRGEMEHVVEARPAGAIRVRSVPRSVRDQGLQLDRLGDVVTYEREARVGEQVADVLQPPSEEIVHAKDLVTLREEAITEV